MKQKIKEALQQGYKNLGLAEEVFERVATSVETFITDESAIEGFVNSQSTKELLTSFQSIADRARAEARAKLNNADKDDAQKDDKNANSKDDRKDDVPNGADLAKVIADAVAKEVQVLKDELATFKSEQSSKSAVAEALARIDAWDYAKGYPKEREKAQRQAMELYEAYGKKWTADELETKIRDKFRDEVADKGIDITKPYESEGGAKNDEQRAREIIDLLKAK